MSTKAVNRLFLVSLFVEAAVVLFLKITGIELHAVASVIITQLIMLIPALSFLIGTKTKPDFITHKRMHPITPVLCVVYTALVMPLITEVNLISQLFVENRASQMAYEMLHVPGWIMILVIGILGPVNEELICRGLYYHSYKKSTNRAVAAMLMSALIFGLLHLNWNQMSYAFVVGIMAVLLIEATGSIVSSMIMHACVNTYNVIVILLQRDTLKQSGGDIQAITDASLESLGISYDQFMMVAIVVYGVIALFTTILALLLLWGISAIEKRNTHLRQIFRKREKDGEKSRQSLWTIPLVIGVVLCVLYMSVMG